VLFGTQLGGGTDINRAIAYGQQLITRPRDSIFVLISDLYEGASARDAAPGGRHDRAGVQVIALLALSDEGAPTTTTRTPRRSPRWACPRSRAPRRLPGADGRRHRARELRGLIERAEADVSAAGRAG
jgi:hypothetical protein